MPACAYAHCTRPEQSKPVSGVEPPHWYGVPRYFLASSSAAVAFGPAPAAGAGAGGGLDRGGRRRGGARAGAGRGLGVLQQPLRPPPSLVW